MISVNTNTIHIWVNIDSSTLKTESSYGIHSIMQHRMYAKKNNFNNAPQISFLRYVLSFYLECIDPAQIMLSRSEHGKPQLVGCESNLQFNVSHTDGISICALSAREDIGVDIERVRYFPYYIDVARTFLTSEEFKLISDLPQHEQLRMFYKLWCIKESCSKGIGLGLDMDFKSLSTVLKNGVPYQVIHSNNDKLETWQVHTLQIHGGYEAFVAAKLPLINIEFYSLNYEHSECPPLNGYKPPAQFLDSQV